MIGSLESNVEMLSDFQTTEERSIEISNDNACEKTSEPHSSFDMNPTTIAQPMEEGGDLFSMYLENFPMALIEVMLFNLEDNGDTHSILSDTHSIKTNTLKSWVPDIELARIETVTL